MEEVLTLIRNGAQAKPLILYSLNHVSRKNFFPKGNPQGETSGGNSIDRDWAAMEWKLHWEASGSTQRN